MEGAAEHHRPLSPESVAEIAEVKRVEAEFLGLLTNLAKHHPAGGREFATAKTNLQQARQWAVEGITA
jgi:hypothetical protein